MLDWRVLTESATKIRESDGMSLHAFDRIRDRFPIPVVVNIPILTTTIVRAGKTIGYIVLRTAAPSIAAGTISVADGTVWCDPKLVGPAFATESGFVAIPFATATIAISGPAQFAPGTITLGAASTLSLTVTPPAVAPAAGDGALGADFRNASLTPFASATIAFTPGTTTIVPSGTASATIYGQTFTVTPSGGAPIPIALAVPHVAIPCTPSIARFDASASVSPEVGVSGVAPVVAASVLFPILDVTATPRPVPADAWAVGVACAGGTLSARFATFAEAATLAGAVFIITPVSLVGVVSNGPSSLTERYALWSATPASPMPQTPVLALPPSTVEASYRDGALIGYTIDAIHEISVAAAALTTVADRPLDASGTRLPLSGPGIVVRDRTAASVAVEIGSTLPAPKPGAPQSYALVAENALLPVSPPAGYLISGQADGNRIAGNLTIGFGLPVVLPTLPDPYAADYAAQAAVEGVTGATVTVTWTATSFPSVGVQTLPVRSAPAQQPERSVITRPGFSLLDVSGAADQWGIQVGFEGVAQLRFDGLELQAPAAVSAVFTVPGISWEPVVDGKAAPAWLAAFSPTDGALTTFLVADTRPTALIPAVALQAYRKAAGHVPTDAQFSLPFGIRANLVDRGSGTTYATPDFTFPAAGLRCARVLSIAGPPAADPLGVALPGSARVGFNAGTPANSDYGALVLGITDPPLPASFWDQQFVAGPTMPVARIDLSGFGTSMFSDWRAASPNAPGVVRARFDVLLGRTAHELVEFQSWIIPWCVRMQRSVVFDRSDGGEVVKHDSGWQPVGPASFELLAGSVLPGAVNRLVNVRNIVSHTETLTALGRTYNRVEFDADVVFGTGLTIAANGQNPAPVAPGFHIEGWALDTIHAAPPAPSPLNPPTPPSVAEIFALMQLPGAGRQLGTTNCVARVGGGDAARFGFDVTSFGAALADGAAKKLQTAVFGTPRLPKDGAWSVARRNRTSSSPTVVAPQAPVPLTRATSPGGAAPGTVPPPNPADFDQGWRLLDPEDAQRVDASAVVYGILQGTGVSKTLLEHPLIANAGGALAFNHLPNLADVGSLLGAAGTFPLIGDALKIGPIPQTLPVQADGFKQTYTWTVAQPERTLLDIAIVHLKMAYHGANAADVTKGTFVIDADPNAPQWSLELGDISFSASVDGLGSDPLLTVIGGFKAGSHVKAGLTGLNVNYGSALDTLTKIMHGLSALAASLGGEAHLDVGFSGQTLSIVQSFTLPTIPLGFGEISDLGLDLGFSTTIPTAVAFHVGLGSKKDPFTWLVFPLAGTGCVVLGVSGGGPDIYIEAGLGVGLAIDVVVASGSASIILSLSLEVSTSAITLTAMLTGRADVDVLGGVASASITLSAAIAISLELPAGNIVDLTATCAVGIHISICWVIDVDFDGSWSFSEQIKLALP